MSESADTGVEIAWEMADEFGAPTLDHYMIVPRLATEEVAELRPEADAVLWRLKRCPQVLGFVHDLPRVGASRWRIGLRAGEGSAGEGSGRCCGGCLASRGGVAST
ncbi:MAG: hypothetical protein ACRDRH_22875 [Pseudonocardia sp.]